MHSLMHVHFLQLHWFYWARNGFAINYMGSGSSVRRRISPATGSRNSSCGVGGVDGKGIRREIRHHRLDVHETLQKKIGFQHGFELPNLKWWILPGFLVAINSMEWETSEKHHRHGLPKAFYFGGPKDPLISWGPYKDIRFLRPLKGQQHCGIK